MTRYQGFRYRDLSMERGRWFGAYRMIMPTRWVGFWFRLPFSHVQHVVRVRHVHEWSALPPTQARR